MKTNLGGGFIDGLGNAFEPLPLYWTDEMVTTNLPNVTGRFIHKSGNFGDLVEGDYVYMIDQRYSLVNSTPFKQLVLYTVNKIVYRQYTAGTLSASYVTYTSRNKPTKSDVGLSAVANVLQFSESNRQIIKEDVLWSGSATSFTKTINANEIYKLTIQDGYGMSTAIFTLADLNSTVSKYVYIYQVSPSFGEIEACKYTAQYNSSTGVWSSFSPKRTIAKSSGSWGWYTSPGITFLRLSRLR